MKRMGFSLIELLAVMLVMILLFSILTPAVRKTIITAKKTRAEGDRKTLEAAVRAYRHEYGKWPDPANGTSGTNIYGPAKTPPTRQSAENRGVIEMMKNDNSANITFLNLSDFDQDASGNIVTATNKDGKYVFYFDLDNDDAWVK